MVLSADAEQREELGPPSTAIEVEEWVELRPGSWTARLWFATDAEARQAVAELRAGGHAAVLGPPDAAHEVGWRNRNAPTVVSPRLAVCFPWVPSPPEVSHVVEIDPGVGFGTGSHPSTRLVLDQLSGRLTGGEHLLDVGCGSGVLAVCSLVLGAASATGIDVNVAGLEAADANARRNTVAARARFSSRGIRDVARAGERFDVVVANIHAPILAEMATELTQTVALDGWLALSGLSPAQVSRLEASFPEVRFEPPVSDDGWSVLVGTLR